MVWVDELAAGEIAAAFEVTAPTISQHLGVLRDAGLVTMAVDRNFRRYRANQNALRGMDAALFEPPTRWTPADDLPETELVAAGAADLVHASVFLACSRDRVFRGFTEPDLYSRWMGVPVRIVHGRFSCDLEWGTKIRGWYDHVVEPSMIALRWNFSDENIPVPGYELVAYMRFSDTELETAAEERGVPAGVRTGTRVDVHQVVDDPSHVYFMQTAWAMVLGRCALNIVAATDPGRHDGFQNRSRSPRTKRMSGK